jgi:anti-sigma factor RsiW
MAAEHLTADELEGYRSCDLPHEAFLAADRHLGECAVCRRTLRAGTARVRLPDFVNELSEPLHPDYEQLSRYVDGLLDPVERQSLEMHMLICASCSKELADLKALDARWKEPVRAEELPKRERWLERLRVFFASPGRVRELGVAFAMLVLGCFVLVQAGRPGVISPSSAGQTARLISLNTAAHSFWGIGGLFLIVAGVAVLLRGLFRKRP